MATTQLTVKSQSSGAGYSAENTTSWSHTDPQRFLETHDVAAAATIVVRWDNVTAAAKSLVIDASDEVDITLSTPGAAISGIDVRFLMLRGTNAVEASIVNNTGATVVVRLEAYG